MENAMANESIFTNFKRELQTLNYAELNYLISDIMLEIKKRSYNEGMVKGMTHGSTEEVAPVETSKSPQQIRDEIVEKAKEDVAEYLDIYKFKFYVNNANRTVVALWVPKVDTISRVVYGRGIAKCDPSDCFNVYIGKAIALRRALKLEVPTEYLNAPQPTEVRVGDVIQRKGEYVTSIKTVKAVEKSVHYKDAFFYRTTDGGGTDGHKLDKIIDDSRDFPIGGICNGEG